MRVGTRGWMMRMMRIRKKKGEGGVSGGFLSGVVESKEYRVTAAKGQRWNTVVGLTFCVWCLGGSFFVVMSLTTTSMLLHWWRRCCFSPMDAIGISRPLLYLFLLPSRCASARCSRRNTAEDAFPDGRYGIYEVGISDTGFFFFSPSFPEGFKTGCLDYRK